MISGRSRLTTYEATREAEARDDLLGDGRAAEHVAPLEHEHAPAGPGEVGGADQAVVAAADHDRVVALGHQLPHPAQGSSRTLPEAAVARLPTS